MKKTILILAITLGMNPLALAINSSADLATGQPNSDLSKDDKSLGSVTGQSSSKHSSFEEAAADLYNELEETFAAVTDNVLNADLNEEAKDNVAEVIYKLSWDVKRLNFKKVSKQLKKADDRQAGTIVENFATQVEEVQTNVRAFNQAIAEGSDSVIAFANTEGNKVALHKKAIDYLRGALGF